MSTSTGPDLFAADFVADPYPVFDLLRRHSPVRAVEVPTGRLWLITRYADARQVLTDPRLTTRLPSEAAGPGLGSPDVHRMLTEHMLNADPPEHTRLRRLVSKVFTPARIERLRPRVQEIADALVDAMLDRRQGDLIADFAFPLPITVICEMLGVPLHDRDSFRAWSNTITASMASGVDDRVPAESLAAYILELIAAKRATLGDDLLSELIAVRDGGDRLTGGELVAMVFLLLIAGHETTVNLIGNGMYLLLTHPDQRRRLVDDPALVPTAVEEFLRYESPVETSSPRFTTEPVEVAGVTIPAGELVLVVLASANRDPERFADADWFDVARRESPHVAFGHGIHFCLGAPLARLEGRIAFETLLRRLPGLSLAVPPAALAWRPGILLRGLVDLPVRW